MPKTLEFLFDFGAPNGYLAWKVLPPLLERTGAELVLTPILLGGVFKATNNRPPIMAYAEVPAKWAYEQLELQRFVTAHGLDRFRLNPHFPVNSLTLMRMAMVAQTDGGLPRFIDAAYAAMWEDGHNMADPEVIAEVLTTAGFDAASLLARAQEPAAKEALAANTQAAIDRGVFGVPTFFIGDEMFWGKERLAQVEAALATVSAT
jgi:2-hydroxychromene-2-carboxylate isomerase